MPPLVGGDGGLLCELVIGKADMPDHYDSSPEYVNLPLTCHPSPSLVTFAFRSSEVRLLLLDLDPCGGTDPLGVFPLFLKRTADVLGPRLTVVCQRLLCQSNFPDCWRQANVTSITKGPSSFTVVITD